MNAAQMRALSIDNKYTIAEKAYESIFKQCETAAREGKTEEAFVLPPEEQRSCSVLLFIFILRENSYK